MINKHHGDRVWHQTWTWTWLYGKQGYLNNKKQIHVYHQEESKKSIRYQANNIEENIMNVKPPPKL